MNFEFPPCWEIAAALRLFHQGTDDRHFKVGNLVTGNGVDARLKDFTDQEDQPVLLFPSQRSADRRKKVWGLYRRTFVTLQWRFALR